MKKTLCLCIILILTLSVCVKAENKNMSAWAEQEINESIELGFVLEKLQCDYQESITRAEFAATAVEYLAYQYNLDVDDMMKLYQEKNNKETITDFFNDISDSEYMHYIWYANTLGIVKGYGDGTFGPNEFITREEAAAMLMRTFFNYNSGIKHGPKLLEFEKYIDYKEISSWAINDVQYVWERNIMKGISDNEFSPKTSYTREQCFATFVRLCKNSITSRYNGGISSYASYEDLINDIEAQPNWVCYEKLDNDKYTILYGSQQSEAAENSQFWIVYKIGGRKRIDNQFNFDNGKLFDFKFDESGDFLNCSQNGEENKYNYKINLSNAKVETVNND